MAPKEKGKNKKASNKYYQPKNMGKINKDKPPGKKFDKRNKKAIKGESRKTGQKVMKVHSQEIPTGSNTIASTSTKSLSLRERMMKRLDAAKFRQMNEDLDSGKSSDDPKATFGSHADFQKYHHTYKERIQNWPSDPLDLIINWIKHKVPQTHVIADFGCGEARLSQSVPNTVHSFDLYALNDRVTACDMSNCPLPDESVDVAVFCLSLMGIDISKYVAEASRVLKRKGLLRIAEVASRFQNNSYASFVQKMKKFGFVSNNKVQEGNAKKNSPKATEDVFFMFEFLKIRPMKQVKGKLPSVKLSPCVYKKR